MSTAKEKANQTKDKKVETSIERSTIFILLAVVVLFIGVVIAIPIVYSSGRDPGSIVNQILSNASKELTENECTSPSTTIETLAYLNNSEAYPFRRFNYLYRPSVILKSIDIIFGFRHDSKSWSIDEISVVDTTTNEPALRDGGFETNYLNLNYRRCVLSDTRTSSGDIYFDNPYEGDFYYNDQTTVGTAYLIQTLQITGGRYYNITFYLENRGDKPNAFLFLIGFIKKK